MRGTRLRRRGRGGVRERGDAGTLEAGASRHARRAGDLESGQRGEGACRRDGTSATARAQVAPQAFERDREPIRVIEPTSRSPGTGHLTNLDPRRRARRPPVARRKVCIGCTWWRSSASDPQRPPGECRCASSITRAVRSVGEVSITAHRRCGRGRPRRGACSRLDAGPDDACCGQLRRPGSRQCPQGARAGSVPATGKASGAFGWPREQPLAMIEVLVPSHAGHRGERVRDEHARRLVRRGRGGVDRVALFMNPGLQPATR